MTSYRLAGLMALVVAFSGPTPRKAASLDIAEIGNLRGTIFDSDGNPLSHVEIFSGSSRVISDSAGHFALMALEAGEVAVVARRLGFSPVRFSITVPADSTVWIAVHMRPSGTVLPDVITTANYSARLVTVGFAERRERMKGAFITREEIEQKGSLRLTDVLKGVPRLTVRKLGSRGSIVFGAHGCVMRVIVDGQPLRVSERPPFHMLIDDVIDPGMIEGMEVYSGATDTPIQFAGITNACGTIVIWTKK